MDILTKSNEVEEVTKRQIWMPLSKNFETNNYEAIISDTSVDRDDERMSKDLIVKWSQNPNKFIPMLIDHENKILNMVGNWEKPQVLEKGEHYALAMQPKWFLSNPKAKLLKEMLDEGAQIGLSIGAIPKSHTKVTVSGQEIKEWTDAELVETSLVPIGSNRHTFMNIAKSFDFGGDAMVKEKLEKQEEPKEEEVEEKKEEKKEEEEEESETKTLKEELAELKKEIKELHKTKTATTRKVELKALAENTEAKEIKTIKEDMNVFEQIAVLKGANIN